MTAEEFLDQRLDLEDSGQWAELEAGAITYLQPPDLEHGTAILNLAKSIAAWVETPESGGRYACFDLGLVLQRDPDTVRFPAVTFFAGGPRFAETDREATETRPVLVVEFASSSERRRQMSARVQGYLGWGVAEVWVIDPRAKNLVRHPSDAAVRELAAEAELRDVPLLPGFRCSIADLFAEPEWWSGRPGSRSKDH